MKNTTGKASPGDPFIPPPAAIWNNMVDAGAAYGIQRLNSGSPSPTRPRSTDLIKLKNDSGEDRRRGEILEISGKAITDLSDETPWLIGVEPSLGFFGILKDPVLNESIVDTQVSGVCLALVVIEDVGDSHAYATPGEYVLRSGRSGPLEILYAPEETGEHPCVVRFAAPPRYMAVLITDLPPDPGIYPTGTISASSNQLTTSQDLTAYADDYTVMVVGAGEDGGVLMTTITAATATTATLADDAVTAVTDAEITILSVADAWVLETDPVSRQLVQKIVQESPLTVPVVNRFRDIEIGLNTLIEIKFMDGEWRPSETDCAASTWIWQVPS